jgi:hypothetical protein
MGMWNSSRATGWNSLSGSKLVDKVAGWRINPRPSLTSRRSILLLSRRRREGTGPLECRLCGVKLLALSSHIRAAHDLTTQEYRARFGSVRMVDAELHQRIVTAGGQTRYARCGKRVCAICGKSFYRDKYEKKDSPAHRWKCCSLACQTLWLSSRHVARSAAATRSRTMTLTCCWCGSTFSHRHYARWGKYCSKRCVGLSKRTATTWTCRGCGDSCIRVSSAMPPSGLCTKCAHPRQHAATCKRCGKHVNRRYQQCKTCRLAFGRWPRGK